MDKITLQIQSIIYKNPKESIFSALDNLEIAIKIAKKEVEGFSDVLFIYGDSSPVQQLSDQEDRIIHYICDDYLASMEAKTNGKKEASSILKCYKDIYQINISIITQVLL